MQNAVRNNACIAAVLALTGCLTAAPPEPKALGVVLAPDGLRLPNSPLEVGLRRARPGAEDALAKLMGAPASLKPPDATCPLTAQTHTNGVTAFYTQRSFVGWAVRDAARFSQLPKTPGVTRNFAGQICPIK